jgi:type IV pilus assembly protein PilY1
LSTASGYYLTEQKKMQCAADKWPLFIIAGSYKMKQSFFRSILMTAALAFAMPGQTEDIDLFLGSPPPESTDAPNIILFIDNSSNWNTAFPDERDAIEQVFKNIAYEATETGEVAYNIGIVMYGVPQVGYVRAAIRPMTAANATLYAAMVNNLSRTGDSTNGRTFGRTISEIHRYLTSAPSVDQNKVTSNDFRDYPNNPAGVPATVDIHAIPHDDDFPHALADSNGKTYTSPRSDSSCADTYVIYVGNNVAGGNVTQDDSRRNTQSGEELELAGGDIRQIDLHPNNQHRDNFADEWARYLHDEHQVTFYTLDVRPTPWVDQYPEDLITGHQNGIGYSALLRSVAAVSNGGYLRVYTKEDIELAFGSFLSAIQAVDSVFASVALPVSSTNQSTFLNQIFIGQFRPDEDALPVWHGNLKQYKVGVDPSTDNLQLQDADNKQAILDKTGFITPCARSSWTPTSTDDYWHFEESGECKVPVNKRSNYPDGPAVEKGGQAYMTRGSKPDTRKVYTCDPANCTGATTLPFFDTNATTKTDIITKTRLGIPGGTDAVQDELINWARGKDYGDKNKNKKWPLTDPPGPVDETDMRPTVHGDVIHSRPAVLNLGSDAINDRELVVFYGSNDGMLRAINGNRTEAIVRNSKTVAAGDEFWAFMPPEFYGDIGRLHGNTNTIRFPDSGVSVGNTGSPKSYGIDGPLTIYDGPDLPTNIDWLFAGMRRSARQLYAFDISDITTPKLLWKKGCPNLIGDSGCTVDANPDYTNAWNSVGQTWSAASLAYAANYGSGTKPLLMMGGGYDDCEDIDNNINANHGCTTTKGNIIYVLDAETGNIQKTFPTLRGVVGNITIVPVSKTNPQIQYAYAADMGGNVYRISAGTPTLPAPISSTPPVDWIITRIASLGCPTPTNDTAGCIGNRKFIFGPDVVEVPDSGGVLFAVILGSGDREKPITSYGGAVSVNNYFYSIIDKPTDATWLTAEATSCGGTAVICQASLTSTTATITGTFEDEDQVATVTALGTIGDKGWKLALENGEQVVTTALTIDNVASFSSHKPVVPTAGSCENNLGRALAYNLNYETAGGSGNQLIGGGLAPSPVGGTVILDNGDKVDICISCGGNEGDTGSIIGIGRAGSGASHIQPTSRVYWKIKK